MEHDRQLEELAGRVLAGGDVAPGPNTTAQV
jgi:hypothetical protein